MAKPESHRSASERARAQARDAEEVEYVQSLERFEDELLKLDPDALRTLSEAVSSERYETLAKGRRLAVTAVSAVTASTAAAMGGVLLTYEGSSNPPELEPSGGTWLISILGGLVAAFVAATAFVLKRYLRSTSEVEPPRRSHEREAAVAAIKQYHEERGANQ